MNEKQLKADAVNEFVRVMIGAFDGGFVDNNAPTLAQIHRVAHHHVKDNYGIELPSIVEQWGEETAKECSKNTITKYLICDDDEGVHEAKNNLSIEETQLLRDKLMDKYPSTAFTIVAELAL